MLNKVLLIGKLNGSMQAVITGKKPTGQLAYARRFGVITSQAVQKKNGEMAYSEEVHPCVLDGTHPDALHASMPANAQIQVEGTLRTRKCNRKSPETYIAVRQLNVLNTPAPKNLTPIPTSPSNPIPEAQKIPLITPVPTSLPTPIPTSPTTHRTLPLPLPDEDISPPPSQTTLPKQESQKRLRALRLQASQSIQRQRFSPRPSPPTSQPHQEQPTPTPLALALANTVEKLGENP